MPDVNVNVGLRRDVLVPPTNDYGLFFADVEAEAREAILRDVLFTEAVLRIALLGGYGRVVLPDGQEFTLPDGRARRRLRRAHGVV